jgi:N-acetylmuramoyl-L-alanine amidase
MTDPIDYTITALTIWREARSEPELGQRAVLHVILNRVADQRWPNTAYGVCLQPLQFSCHNANDPNATKWPKSSDLLGWSQIRAIVDNPGDDPTHGANHYHVNGLNPSWADPKKITARIGSHTFYRL